MLHKIYHGDIQPEDIAQALVSSFARGNYQVRQGRSGEMLAVQVASAPFPSAGGQTAISVLISSVEDGISVQVGQQSLWGVAASFGQTVFSALRNPISLLNRLDDVAQDVESLQLSDEIWKVVDRAAAQRQATQELSEKLRRLVCPYCLSANPVGEPACVACGAPLGDQQPGTCLECGTVLVPGHSHCPNCGVALSG